jgi:O-antigen/teichoic acid export membrane protein
MNDVHVVTASKPSHAAQLPGGNAPAPLTAKVGSAFALSLANTAGTKLVGLVLQIVLARLLDPRDFGLIALAYTVTTFIGLFQQMGVREILIQRQRHFERWANAAFWLCVLAGLGAAALTVAAAPIAAGIYHEPKLVPLLTLMGVSIPLANLSVVPWARLAGEMRFGVIYSYGIVSAVFTAGLTIAFAAAGFGVYSFVLPGLCDSAVRAVVFWWVAGFRPRLQPQWRRWRFIVADSAFALGANTFFVLVTQGDNMVLGRVAGAKALGVYAFAFGLSMQATVVLLGNLFEVLFPSLASMGNDPKRQTDALLRAMRLICTLVVPTCFLQAATASPVVHLLFAPKWYSAIPVIQILSIGTAVHVLGWPAHGLMQAQGRFRTNFLMSIWMGLLVVGAVRVGLLLPLKLGAPVATAVAAIIAYAIMQPIYLYVVIKPAGRGWRDVLGIFAMPCALSAAAVFGAYGVAAVVVPSGVTVGRNVANLAMVVGVSGLLYFLAAWYALPAFRELVATGLKVVKRPS